MLENVLQLIIHTVPSESDERFFYFINFFNFFHFNCRSKWNLSSI